MIRSDGKTRVDEVVSLTPEHDGLCEYCGSAVLNSNP